MMVLYVVMESLIRCAGYQVPHHRIHSIRDHFSTERTKQCEGNTVYTLTEVGCTLLSYFMHYQERLLRKKMSPKLNILTLFYKFTSEYFL